MMGNRPPQNFLEIDLAVQKIIGGFTLVLVIAFPIGAMLLLIIFGGWQIFSAIVGISYGSRWRKIYLLLASLYGVYFLSCVRYVDYHFSRTWMYYVMLAFLIIVPIVLGVVYYINTSKEVGYGKSGKKESEMPDILDADL